MSARGRISALAYLVALALWAQLHVGCGSVVLRAESAAIVSSGVIVQDLTNANEDAYTAATTTLRQTILARGGSISDYDHAVLPMNAEFDTRVHALAAASTTLYAAAGMVDAAQHDGGIPPTEAARIVLSGLTELFNALQTGDVLPPIKIPPSAAAVAARLSAIVFPGGDGGT